MARSGRNAGQPQALDRVVEEVRFLWDAHVLARETATRRFARDGQRGSGPPLGVHDDLGVAARKLRPAGATVSRTQGGKTLQQRHLIVTDAIRTPRDRVTAAGKVTWQAQATLWGEIDAPRAGATPCPIGFQGRDHDGG